MPCRPMQIYVFDGKAKLQWLTSGRESGSSPFPKVHYADDKGDVIFCEKIVSNNYFHNYLKVDIITKKDLISEDDVARFWYQSLVSL